MLTETPLPIQATLHQGAIESIFLDSMRKEGVEVERPILPTSIEISRDEKLAKDPKAHAVKVVLKHLDPADPENDSEIVHARFVVGADGA